MEATFGKGFGQTNWEQFGISPADATVEAIGQVYAGGIDKSEYDYNRNLLKQINKEYHERIEKIGTTTNETAVGTNYSTTSGNIPTLIPLWLSPDIINLSQKDTPVYALLPKMAVKGKWFIWNKAQFNSNSAQFLAEDAALSENDDTYTQAQVQMKYCYAVGRVTGPMQVHTRGYIDMERQEILMKTRALLQKLEYTILNGDTGSDANEFDGFGKLITTNATTLNDSISISAIRNAILYAKQGGTTFSETIGGGNPDLIITDLATYNDIKALLDPYQRYVNTTNIAWGIETFTFDGIPVVASKFMTTTSGSKSLYVIDTSVVRLGVALDITFERLAKTNDSDKFMIKWYGALIVLNERYCAKITSIS